MVHTISKHRRLSLGQCRLEQVGKMANNKLRRFALVA